MSAMAANVLTYASSGDNGLSFELRVDGVPLGTLVGAKDTELPYWIFHSNDLPHWPPDNDPSSEPNARIVCVCSCGEYGCGHTRCTVTVTETEVVMHSFDQDVGPSGHAMAFHFSRANYEAVVTEISAQANARRAMRSN